MDDLPQWLLLAVSAAGMTAYTEHFPPESGKEGDAATARDEPLPPLNNESHLHRPAPADRSR